MRRPRVLVRRGDGASFVHPRAETKDLWPGAHDCAAGWWEPDAGLRRQPGRWSAEQARSVRGAAST